MPTRPRQATGLSTDQPSNLDFAQAQTYARELRELYVARRATQAELDQTVAELEAAQGQLLDFARRLAESNRKLQESYLQTLQAMAIMVDRRDGVTGEHCIRVALFSRLLGERIVGNDVDALRTLEYGALLHDIGKIGVPDAILRKSGPLDDDEWQIMRAHPVYGCEMLSGIEFLQEALPIVRHHHERFDGDGYPDGLRGEAIPLGARIFAVADAFDAMTAERHYRAAMSLQDTVDELERHSGSQFDPAVVSALARDPSELVMAAGLEVVS
jgi:putative nucleotidyltransferase with HDIG domain